MRTTNKTILSGKTTAINPAKTIHRATTSIDPRVPHTNIITTALIITNPAPRPLTAPPPSLYIN
jgi:hypothetical protein